MSIAVTWDSPENQAIIRYIFDGMWTWAEFAQANRQSKHMLENVNQEIAVILDMRESDFIQAGAMARMQYWPERLHPRVDMWIFVGASAYIKTLARVYNRLYGRGTRPAIHFAHDLPTARQMIAHVRGQTSV
ncbi:MAG: hypothetical protein D6712_10625 [Chloroflexi bacterium]|nr:MAG: hypothetical protein D6712_10625 [Chloroflexota bacterium]